MMKIKQRGRSIILYFCIGILLSLFCVRVYSLSRRFPPATVENYLCGESVSIDAKGKYTDGKTVENTFQITAFNFKVYTKSELIGEHQLKEDDIPEDRFPQYEKRVLMLKASIKNTSQTEQVLELYNVNMQCATLGWSSEVDLDWFKTMNAANPKMSLQPSIKPGETLTMFLPYEIDNDNLTNHDFNKIDKEKFDLVLSLYPKKKLINLNY